LPAALGTLRYFGNYELLEEIARGGMGVVYRARQVNLNREVAVKVMLHGALAAAADVERFRAEASAAAALRHPGIVAIHEIGEHEGQHYFSMDLVTGRNLDDFTRSGPLAARPAAQLVAAIARAVAHAHAHGVLHRDIKPSNVIVDAEGLPHVTDFGLARRMVDPSGLTLAGQILGTPGFMAPEQASGDPAQVGVAADVYSLGAVLYQVLTGRPAFMGANLLEVLRQVAETEPVAVTLLNPTVPRDLETIVQKCMNKDAGRRYASAAALADDLERFLRHEPIRARPIGAAGRLVRWVRRNPAVAALAGTVAALLVAVASVAVVSAARIERARRAEVAQRMEAEARLRQGEHLIQFMLGDLADRLKPVGRLDVLDSTIAQVDRFYSDLPANALTYDSERNRANALRQVADIRSLQGRFAEAEATFKRALAAYGGLVARHPDDLALRGESLRAEEYFAILYLQQENDVKAVPLLEHCLRERQELARLMPTDFTLLGAVGGTAQNLAVAERRLGHFDRTATLVRTAEDAYRQWVAGEPANPLPKERLATVRGTTGHFLFKIGKYDEAEKAYREKLSIFEALIRQDPKNTGNRSEHASGFGLLGELEIKRSRLQAAVDDLSRGIGEYDGLVAADPTNLWWQANRVNQLLMRGEAEQAAGRWDEALADFQRVAVETEQHPGGPRAFGSWAGDYGEMLEQTAATRRLLAAAERKAGHADAAARQEALAAAAQAKWAALPKP
jgi:tetratricopeptide (TPR) repeat protein